MDDLNTWVGANVSEGYRAAVLAVADGLEDLRSSDLDELEDLLALNSWPVLTRRRFVDAWRQLKGEGAAAPEAAAPVAPTDVEAPEPLAEAAAEPDPPAPAPRDDETLEPRDGDDWAATARELLRDIKGENGNGHTGIKGLWPKLARYGFSTTQAGICRGRGTIFPPANFPKSTRKIKSLKGQNGLVEYLESLFDPAFDPALAAMTRTELRRAMARCGVGAPPRPPQLPRSHSSSRAQHATGGLPRAGVATLRPTTRGASRAAHAAVRREITALCHEMTEAVDLLVSPQFARQEIRALCRSMTEEVDARAVAAEEEDEDTLDILRAGVSRSANVDALSDDDDDGKPQSPAENNQKTGRWTDEEHARFLRGLELFGKKWTKVADVVQSRTTLQVRSHAQKYLKKFEEDSDDDEQTLEAMRLKSQDPNYRIKRDEERERKAQLRARQDLDQLENAAPEIQEDECSDLSVSVTGKRWGAEEQAELRELVEEHRPTGSNEWRQIAELLGTGRSASTVENKWDELAADAHIQDEFSDLSGSQLKKAMRARRIGRSAYDLPIDFRRKLRAFEAKRPRPETESDDDDAPAKPHAAAAPEPEDAAADTPRLTAAPPDESVDDEEAAVGRRVWALFEPDVWWGGTVVSISGVEDECMCSIVFDDGILQTFYARDVWSSPLAGGKVGAQGPNAQARAAITKALSAKATTPLRPKPRKRPKRGFYAAYAESSEPAPAPAPRRVTPVAPSGNCPICYEKLSRDATVFECSHAMCASCSDSYAKSEVERSMSRRSGVSVACPLCRAPSKVVLPEEMHTSLSLGPTKRRRRSTDE